MKNVVSQGRTNLANWSFFHLTSPATKLPAMRTSFDDFDGDDDDDDDMMMMMVMIMMMMIITIVRMMVDVDNEGPLGRSVPTSQAPLSRLKDW